MNTAASGTFNETGTPANATSNHNAGETSLSAWGSGSIDSGSGETVGLECGNCHNPHGNDNYRILRPKPTSLLGWDGLTAVDIPDEETKTYTISYDSDNYRDLSQYPIGIQSKATEWCSQCHTRYSAAAGSGSTTSGDSIFDYRHITYGLSAGCFKCHVAHGSSATMGFYSGSVAWPGGGESSSGNARSSLLNIDNRGVCAQCHLSEAGEVGGHGDGGGCESCHGASGSHATHINSNTRGPATPLGCGDCHDTDNYPSFSDGKDLASTTACDSCHSPGGSFNGVNSAGASVGAKDNWSSGVYDSELKAGKERWCVGCHDDVPATVDSASAPDMSLFWNSGHGRSSSVECENCHDTGTGTHIDGDAETYSFDSAYYESAQSGVAYAAAYRLKYIGAEVPLMIPTNYNITFSYNAQTMKDNAFRICFDSCHDPDKVFDNTPGDGIDSNFKASLPNPPRDYSYAWGSGADVNEHVAHIMNYVGPFWDSDWDNATLGAGGSSGRDSLMACSSCHNVHGAAGSEGSSNEAMIRDGTLVGRKGYGFSYVIEDGAYPQVTSDGAIQSTSVGAIFRQATEDTPSDSMCGGSMCHGNPTPPAGSSYDATGSSWGTYLEFYRTAGNYGPYGP